MDPELNMVSHKTTPQFEGEDTRRPKPTIKTAKQYIKESAKRDKEQYLNDTVTEAENAAYRNDLLGVYAA